MKFNSIIRRISFTVWMVKGVLILAGYVMEMLIAMTTVMRIKLFVNIITSNFIKGQKISHK